MNNSAARIRTMEACQRLLVSCTRMRAAFVLEPPHVGEQNARTK